MAGQVRGLLKSNARSAHHHLRRFFYLSDGKTMGKQTFGQLHSTVDNTRRVVPFYGDAAVPVRRNAIALRSKSIGGGGKFQRYGVVVKFSACEFLLQVFRGISLTISGIVAGLDSKLSSHACIVLNAFAHLWAVVFPDIPWPIGILQKFLLRCPVVAEGNVRRAFIGI